MNESKRAFIDFMLECKVLKFGDFTTKSGRKTPYFINTGAYVTGAQIARLGQFYAGLIDSEFGDGVDNLFGPAYKGIPLIVAAASSLHRDFGREVTWTFNRKEAKDHGEGGWLVGFPYGKDGGRDGKRPTGETRVVIVEDVTTAGTSVRETLPAINALSGTRVVGLAVSVDRMEKGQGSKSALQELREEFGLKTCSLVDFMDLMEFLEERMALAPQDFPPDIHERMARYREQYGAV